MIPPTSVYLALFLRLKGPECNLRFALQTTNTHGLLGCRPVCKYASFAGTTVIKEDTMHWVLRHGMLLPVLTFLCGPRGVHSLTALDVCAEFVPGGSQRASWSLDDCVELWTTWSLSIDSSRHASYPDRQVWKTPRQ